MAIATLVLLSCALPRQGVSQASDGTPPPHRRHHAIGYDPATKRVLVLGGQHLVSTSDAPMLDDLWSWDGDHWTRVATTGTANIARGWKSQRAVRRR